MNSPISYLPVWKANATPAERLRELAHMAEKYPERFDNFVIAYTERVDADRVKTNYHCFNLRTTEAIGMLEIAKVRLYEDTNG